ncbi:TPA: hypothetical protein ACGF9M_001272, partial [Vibrio cholerae]
DAKIIYNVTVDESSLEGLTADEAYSIQKERLARERKEKREKEAARRKKIRDEMDEDLRQWQLEQARKTKNESESTPD